jgi:hypothetical protein
MLNRVFFAALRAHAPDSPVFCRLINTQNSPPPPHTLQNKMILPVSIKPGLLTVKKRVPTKELFILKCVNDEKSKFGGKSANQLIK